MGDSSASSGRSEVQSHRDTALKLLQLDLTVATIVVVGIALGVGTPNSEDLRPFLNVPTVLGCASIVASTVLALLLVIETTFSEAADETGWLHDRLAGFVGLTVVVAGWSLPLFATGGIVGLYGGWDLPSAVWRAVVLLVLLHLAPTVYLLRRSYFARFGYPSHSPQNE